MAIKKSELQNGLSHVLHCRSRALLLCLSGFTSAAFETFQIILLVDSSPAQSSPSNIYFHPHLLVAHFPRDLYLYPVLTSSEARLPHNSPPGMESKWCYPRDLKLALKNTFSEEEVTRLISRKGTSPRFVYDALMLPTVLKYYLDMDQTTNIDTYMTQATLFGYQLHRFNTSGTPVICPSSDSTAKVQGMLVFNLNEQQRNAIYEFEEGLLRLVSVQVQIRQEVMTGIDTLRIIDAGTFVWRGQALGLIPIHATSWKPDQFLQSPFYQHIEASQKRSLG